MKFLNSISLYNIKDRLRDLIITIALLGAATGLSFAFFYTSDFDSPNIALLYILALILISRYTSGYLPGIIASIVGVICINYIFTYPYFKLNFTITGYPITFLAMLSISLITSTTTTNLKKQGIALAEKEKLIAEGEKERMRATLLRSISHDLRTPLTSIIGASTSLNNNNLDLSEEERKHLICNITEDANWLLNMVENILSVTKIQDDVASLTKTPEALEEVLTDSVLRLKKRIPNAEIVHTLPEEFILVPMDALLIEQVVINLLENAVIHSHSAKPIELYTTIESDTITIHIRDYGVGFVHNNSNVSDGEKGFGLGLSICQTIVQAHDGELHVTTLDDGTEFYFSLPKET